MKGKKAVASGLRPSRLIYLILGFGIGMGIHMGLAPSQDPPVVHHVVKQGVEQVVVENPQGPLPALSFTVLEASKAGIVKEAPKDDDDEDTEAVQYATKSVLGKHKSKYPDIPFPKPIPQKPPAEDRHTLVALMTRFQSWEEGTLRLLQYFDAMPDAIDVVVIDDGEEPDLANKAVALGYPVLRGPEKPMDRAAAINTAWAYFRRKPKYDRLVVMQNDDRVYHWSFDTINECYKDADKNAVMGPLVNAMMAGEKSSDMDEKALKWQNSQHRINRPYFKGRVPKDTHMRLPFTLREHNEWLSRALKVAGTSNFTRDAEMLQSFFLVFPKEAKPIPDDPDRVVKWGFNLFQKSYSAMYDITVNGKAGERDTAQLTYFADPRVPMGVCLKCYVYHNWSVEGLIEEEIKNIWYVPARRNPKRHPPPSEARWERG